MKQKIVCFQHLSFLRVLITFFETMIYISFGDSKIFLTSQNLHSREGPIWHKHIIIMHCASTQVFAYNGEHKRPWEQWFPVHESPNFWGKGSLIKVFKSELEVKETKNVPERTDSLMKYSSDRVIYGGIRNNFIWLQHKIWTRFCWVMKHEPYQTISCMS